MKIAQDTKIAKSLNLPAGTSLDELRDLIGDACSEWAASVAGFDGGYVVEVYNDEVVYCVWLEAPDGSKYYKLSWKSEGRSVTVADPLEVVRATSFVAISKAAELSEVVKVPPANTSIFDSLLRG